MSVGLRHPYSVLLPVGFTLPPPLPEARCAFTAPFHPCPRDIGPRDTPSDQDRAGGLFSVALSLGSPPPAVSRHRIPVEPGLSSIPRVNGAQRPSGRLAAGTWDVSADCVKPVGLWAAAQISPTMLLKFLPIFADDADGMGQVAGPGKVHRYWLIKRSRRRQTRFCCRRTNVAPQVGGGARLRYPLAPQTASCQRAARIVSALLASKPPGASTPRCVTLPSSAIRA